MWELRRVRGDDGDLLKQQAPVAPALVGAHLIRRS
jgi:hypothetical protein